MPRKDTIHEAVKTALIKGGWTVTHDPYVLKPGEENMQVDLAAQRLLAAERAQQKIAVEIKSFLGRSPVNDLQNALGQYLLYLGALEIVEPQRKLYLALGKAAYHELNEMETFRMVVRRFGVALIVVELLTEEVVQWKE